MIESVSIVERLEKMKSVCEEKLAKKASVAQKLTENEKLCQAKVTDICIKQMELASVNVQLHSRKATLGITISSNFSRWRP
jgi:hypothetical protein